MKDKYGTFLPEEGEADDETTPLKGYQSDDAGHEHGIPRRKRNRGLVLVGGIAVLLGVLAVSVKHSFTRGVARGRAGRVRRTSMFAKPSTSAMTRGTHSPSSSSLPPPSETDGAESSDVPTDLQPPNFLVIMADDVGMGDLGYKNSLIKSPFIDNLASKGIQIERFYTQALCTPARGAFLTGLYPIRTGTQYDTVESIGTWGLDLDAKTLPEHLKDIGYKTHLVGKWHLGHAKREYLPTSRGFDTYMGYLEAEETYYSHQTTDVCGCGGPYYDFVKSTSEKLYFVVNNSTRSDKLYAERAVQVIKAHNTTHPLYLQMTFQNAHRPLADVVDADFSDEQLEYLGTVSPPARQRFTAAIMKLDDAVSRIVTALDEKGILNTTFIVFLSDNGGCYQSGGINYPYRGTKSHLWEGGVRTPSFIAGNLIPETLQGTTYTSLFHVTDWAPTILSLAGWGSESQIDDLDLDGYNQAPALLYEQEAPRLEVLLNYENVTDTPSTGIIVGKWKLLINELNQSYYDVEDSMPYLLSSDEGTCTANDAGTGDSTNWLFDLETDPLETTNVYDDHPDVVTNLINRINDYLYDGVKSYVEEEGSQDSAALFAFESVGYVCPWLDEDKSYYTPPTYVDPLDDSDLGTANNVAADTSG